MQLLSLLPTLRAQILAAVAILSIGLSFGWHLHSMWDSYMDTSALHHQLAAAQAVPGKQAIFHQKLKATPDAKTPCFATPLSPELLKLIK